MENQNCQCPILIIEDEPAVRQTMQDILEIQGYSVVAAANGSEALDILSKGIKPTVILLDLMMPVMNGWHFLDHQRSNPNLKDIPVVVCSAYSESAKSVHPSAIVEKPVQLDALLDAVKAFCA